MFRDIGCLAGLACLVLGGGGGWATKEILLSDGEGANFFAIWPELLSLLCLLQRYPFVASVFHYKAAFYMPG